MIESPSKILARIFLVATILVVLVSCRNIVNAATAANICPFCSAVALTFTQQMNEKDVVVVAKLVVAPPPPSADDDDFPDGQFEIVSVLKGGEIVKSGMTFATQLVGVYPVGQKFLVMGQGAPQVAWTTPMKASDRVFDYLEKIQTLPESGPERLTFFQDYFEDKEKILAFDAYDEFAAAPYEDLIAMKKNMDRDKLIGFIKSPKTTVNRRRLYFTMLGVCGKSDEDVKMLEGFLKSGSRKQQAGLDALVGCYLTLAGKKGLPLISKQFLRNPEADYVDISQVVDALRFHATEAEVIETKDIVAAVRVLLDHPDHADIVIEDLARWKDWSVMDKLVQMFKDADDDSNWQRVPIITYLRACPKPEAAKHIEELKKIDPQAVQRADFYLGIGNSDDDWNDKSPTEDDSDDKSAAMIVDPAVSVASFESVPVTGTNSDVAAISETRPPLPPSLIPEPDEATQQKVASTTSLSYAKPVGSSDQSFSVVLRIVLVPMATSLLILGLMWSVVNGWFERLIF